MTAMDEIEMLPTGIEGGVDTNARAWITLEQLPGVEVKPLRASSETGMFSTLLRLEAARRIESLVILGALDMTVLSGTCRFEGPDLDVMVSEGVYGYIPANTRIDGILAETTTEILVTAYGPIAVVEGARVISVVTARDLQRAAADHDVWLVPNTLAECLRPRPEEKLDSGEPLAIADPEVSARLIRTREVAADAARHPHFVDTRAIDFFFSPDDPDIGLKVLRVSAETGVVSLQVRHNGTAGPHYHLGPADFLVLSGRIGYRAGPPEGYGAGVWFFEPAGARHEATHRIGTEDLVYTANVYGPIQFDSGVGTPIVAVASWMVYQAIAEAAGFPLVANVFEGDASLLAWAPLGSAPTR